MTSSNNRYFILTKQSENRPLAKPGSICYISEYKYSSLTRTCTPTKLPVCFLDTRTMLDYELEFSCMQSLSEEEAKLLQALSTDAERLEWFRERDALQAAQGLTVGTAVTVDEGGERLRGIVRYIGSMTEPSYSCPVQSTFFGIELQVGDFQNCYALPLQGYSIQFSLFV